MNNTERIAGDIPENGSRWHSWELKQKFVFPLVGYKKENGFLGIVSKYNGKIRFFTKSTDNGDYVNWFIGALCDNYELTINGHGYSWHYSKDNGHNCRELRNLLEYKLNSLIQEGYSYVFECVDPVNDPHIIKYDKTEVYLLEVFKNQLKEEHVDYEDLISISNALLVPVKEKELEFNNWEEFEEWKTKFREGITQWDCKHEGYVFEDQAGYRVKFKSSFYQFWKQMRTLKERIQGGRQNIKIYKTKEEIEVVKLLEGIDKEELKKMSIIDVEEMFYKNHEN